MNPEPQDRFVIFFRADRNHPDRDPEGAERPLAICDTYAEARRLRAQYHFPAGECVIRFVGTAGGGD